MAEGNRGTPLRLPLGPVMADVAGFALAAEEAEFLRHPAIGAVILFARNYQNPEQLRSLTASIRALREPQLLIAVDHEGGRVQRFREGFTAIPPMQKVGEAYEADAKRGLALAQAVGLVIGAELAAHGVDFSFTPVLDVDFGASAVIGNRAFSRDTEIIGVLANALCDGLARAGSASVGKHFPGHGFVSADSHIAIPVDERDMAVIEATDLAPYRMLARRLDGVMPAHVIYPKLDAQPAGFSRFWLQEVLRARLQFGGMIFSDDLSMEGAAVAGDVVARGRAAFGAGCDMVLVCNAPEEARKLVAGLGGAVPALDQSRAQRMSAKLSAGVKMGDHPYRDAVAFIAKECG